MRLPNQSRSANRATIAAHIYIGESGLVSSIQRIQVGGFSSGVLDNPFGCYFYPCGTCQEPMVGDWHCVSTMYCQGGPPEACPPLSFCGDWVQCNV